MGMCKVLIAGMIIVKAQAAGRAGLGFHRRSTRTASTSSRCGARRRLGRDRSRLGLTRAAIEAAAQVYARAESVIGIYGMGLTQHVKGVGTVADAGQSASAAAAISGARAPASGRCAAIPTSRASARSASRRSPNSCPLDRLAEQSASRRRAIRV